MAKPLQIATVNGFYSFYHAFSVVDIAFANGQFSQRTAFDSTELMIDVDWALQTRSQCFICSLGIWAYTSRFRVQCLKNTL